MEMENFLTGTEMKTITTERYPIKMWLDEIDAEALRQAKNLANLPFVFKWIALMPDSHVGFGMPIGGVLATREVIIPNCVGVDIGCGMAAVKTDISGLDTGQIKMVLSLVRQWIPVGFTHQHSDQPWEGFNRAPDIPIIQEQLASARRQLGTLGGGNHFLEIQRGDDGSIWLMVHSGSRNFGLQTASTYHKKAVALSGKWAADLPDKDLSFLPVDSKEGRDYFAAMNFCLQFAAANRALMMQRFTEALFTVVPGRVMDEINIHHNYAAFETHFGREVLVHRKGATRADAGLLGIIPGSMGTASYITQGLGNPDSFMSCSHGAGRRLGRKQAIRTLNLEAERRKLEGIVHGVRAARDLEEAPGAYKDIDLVMDNQKDLTKILVRLRPLGVVKG